MIISQVSYRTNGPLVLYVTGCSNIGFLDLGVNFVQMCHIGCRIQILEIRLIKIMHIVAHKV